jgi:hypothetical protein
LQAKTLCAARFRGSQYYHNPVGETIATALALNTLGVPTISGIGRSEDPEVGRWPLAVGYLESRKTSLFWRFQGLCIVFGEKT